jgi:hypothetical protein
MEVAAFAKDGTVRGGGYGSGRKREDLSDRALVGRPATVIQVPGLSGTPGLPPAGFIPADMPSPDEYLFAPQSNGAALGADAIFTRTWPRPTTWPRATASATSPAR